MDRRAALRAGLVLGGAFVMPGDEGRLDVQAEAARTAELRAEYVAAEPGALQAFIHHGHRVGTLMGHARGSVDEYKLGMLYADVSQQLSLITYKSNDYSGARWWAEQAQVAATKTSNVDLVAVALCRRSNVLVAKNFPGAAMNMTSHARDMGLGPHARALVEVHLARALGKRGHQGDDDDALRALDRAQASLEEAQRRGVPAPSWAGGLTQEQLVYHRGDVLISTQPKRANFLLIAADQALHGEKQTHAYIQVRRAETALALRDYDKAVALAAEGLAIVLSGGAMREINRVVRLRDNLAKVAPARLVKELDSTLVERREVRGSLAWRQDHR